MTWLTYLAIATVLAHGLGEWFGDLANWSIHYQYQHGAFAPWQAPRWLELGLPVFATTWNGATIAAGLAWPAYQGALWSIAAGGMLADALAIHVAGRLRFGHWPPGSITVPIYLVAGGAWAWHHPSWWLLVGAAPFVPYWWLVALYNGWAKLLDEVAAEVFRAEIEQRQDGGAWRVRLHGKDAIFPTWDEAVDYTWKAAVKERGDQLAEEPK